MRLQDRALHYSALRGKNYSLKTWQFLPSELFAERVPDRLLVWSEDKLLHIMHKVTDME